HNRLALRQAEVHLADQLDNVVDGLLEADVDEGVVAIAAVDQVDVDAEPAAGLVIQLDDVGKEVLPAQHGSVRGGPEAYDRPAGLPPGRPLHRFHAFANSSSRSFCTTSFGAPLFDFMTCPLIRLAAAVFPFLKSSRACGFAAMASLTAWRSVPSSKS